MSWQEKVALVAKVLANVKLYEDAYDCINNYDAQVKLVISSLHNNNTKKYKEVIIPFNMDYNIKSYVLEELKKHKEELESMLK